KRRLSPVTRRGISRLAKDVRERYNRNERNRHGLCPRSHAMRTVRILCLVFLIVGCGKKEALHKGKTSAEWQGALPDPDAQTRREAANALGALKAGQYAADLTAALKDPDGEVRVKAAEAIWSIGSDAKESVPDLIALLKDKNPGLRLNAAGALG